jgi:hypothetical protein
LDALGLLFGFLASLLEENLTIRLRTKEFPRASISGFGRGRGFSNAIIRTEAIEN